MVAATSPVWGIEGPSGEWPLESEAESAVCSLWLDRQGHHRQQQLPDRGMETGIERTEEVADP